MQRGTDRLQRGARLVGGGLCLRDFGVALEVVRAPRGVEGRIVGGDGGAKPIRLGDRHRVIVAAAAARDRVDRLLDPRRPLQRLPPPGLAGCGDGCGVHARHRHPSSGHLGIPLGIDKHNKAMRRAILRAVPGVDERLAGIGDRRLDLGRHGVAVVGRRLVGGGAEVIAGGGQDMSARVRASHDRRLGVVSDRLLNPRRPLQRLPSPGLAGCGEG